MNEFYKFHLKTEERVESCIVHNGPKFVENLMSSAMYTHLSIDAFVYI